MLHGRRMKRGAAFLLAFCLIFTAAQWQPYEAKAAEGENLARLEGVTATASSSEADSLTAEKVIDGDTSSRESRWGSALGGGPQWIQLAWESAQSIQNVRIYWERKNIKDYEVQVSNDGETWTPLYANASYPAKNVEVISFAEAASAKYLRVFIGTVEAQGDDKTETAWQTASMYELEAYDGEIPDGRSEAQKIADSIEAPVIGEQDTKISIPEAPKGVEISFYADYEQVIGEDGTIYRPLETRTVKGFYEITCPASAKEPEGSLVQTAEFEITVPGQYEAQRRDNAKPAVIPELQEWHGARGDFVAEPSSRIVVKDGGLSEVAEKFARDYKEVTGLDIEVVTGAEASAGDFFLALTRGEGLGKEGYTMEIGDSVTIEAEQAAGAYWATRTALQILKQKKGLIPKGLIRDYPKYEVRGFSLDVGRKPFTLDALYEFAENMAWYKMNSFQVHLSDNLIFHEDYPTLEEAAEQSYAGNRLQSDLRGSTGKTSTAEDVFYTKAEFKTFIQDCRVMGVDIVPEFDMPAHALPWTRAFPEYQAKRAGGSHAYLIEELDLSLGSQVDEWAKSVWNEYFEDGTFDEEMTVHIGTDEYHGTSGQQGKEEFRRFSAALINFVQSKGRTVRMWGSLTNKTGNTPVPSEGVQLNIWNMGYANPSDMYNLGYDLINTLEGPNYIVPAAGYYNDYINANNIYSSWQPNVIGNLTMKPGDGQMLGGCYAIWHDSVDTRANGISQYDSFDRFFQALPAYGAKLWGDAKDRDYNEFSRVFSETGTAPGTTINGDVDSVSSTVASYGFDGNEWTKDSGANGYDLGEQKNVSQTAVEGGNALKLNGGESYAETPLNQIGSNAVLTMKVKMDADAEGEQILCESKDVCGTYGTYAFKAVQKHTGKVGFSREGYDYSFNYTLPENQWVTLEFWSGKEMAELYVDGELVDNKHYNEDGTLATTQKGNQTVEISSDNKPDIYFANHETTELSEKLVKEGIRKIATMHVPFGRIGSKTKSFKGEIDFASVTSTKETTGDYKSLDRAEWAVAACSVHDEGPIGNAVDGNKNTYWHQNYGNDTSLGEVNDIHPNGAHWFEITLPEAETVSRLTYLPRQDSTNGRILEYGIVVTKADGSTETVADHREWENNGNLKTAIFAPVEAKKVKLLIYDSTGEAATAQAPAKHHATIAELNLYGDLSVEAVKKELRGLAEGYGNYQKDDYTEISWNELQSAKDMAEQILESESNTAEDYIAAYERLDAALAGLIAKQEERRELPGEIEAAEEILQDIDEENYTKESIQNLKDVIAAARAELENQNATAASIKEKYDALKNAHLETVAQAEKKSQLLEAVNDASSKELKDTRYTKESLEALREAVQNARELVAGGASVEELQAALDEITEAKKNLAFNVYTVSFNSQGGSAVAPQKVTAGQKAKAPANPKRTGYIFDGWYAEASCRTKYNFASPVTKALTLYAKWRSEAKPQEEDPFKAGAQMTDTKKKITYKVISAGNETAMVFKGNNKKATSVTIPATVSIYGHTCKVVTVGAGAFQGYNKMTKVTLGKNVTAIEKNAFAKCKKLATITMKGKTLVKVKSGAFKGTAKNLTVKAPKGMKKSTLLKTLKKGGNKRIKVK